MSNWKNREFVNPTGVSANGSILLAIVRILLGVCLLYTDPLSSRFGFLLIFFFLISVARHLLFYFSKPIPDNMYNFWLDLFTPCLYGFILFHVLSIYDSSLLSLAVSIFLPAIVYTFLFAGDGITVMSKGIFWSGLTCYVLFFLVTLNYVFDLSKPVVEKYFLAKKYAVTTLAEDGGPGGDAYYFDLIHVDSVSAPAQWIEVNQKMYNSYQHSWKYKRITLDSTVFIILDKKGKSAGRPPYYFLLLKTNGPFYAKIMTEPDYARFENGDTFHVEKHRGMLGVEWLTYR